MPSSPSAPSGLRSLGEHLCASFPITPSRTYGNAALKEGRVHLDLLAGRENARGTVGGNAATTITDGSVQLNVAAGSLDEDTAIAFFAYDTFSSFIPSTNAITPLGEVTIDLGSSTLNTSASLTFHNVAAAPGDTLVVARVDRAEFDGIPRLQVVALADVVTASGETNAVSRVDTGLPGLVLDGIKIEGRYTLLRLAGPVGWLKGLTTASGSPVRALVSTSTLPFFATSSGTGAFAIPAAPGAVTLTARVLGQSLVGAVSAVAIEGTPVAAEIALQGTVSQASVVPVSGSVGVEVNEPLTLTSLVALNPNTVIPANISLRRVPPQRCAEPDPPASLNCAATQIPLRLVLSGSGKQLSIVPTAPVTIPATPALEFSTDYRLEVTGLLDAVGGLVTAPTITFRTKADVKPVYNLTAITFSLPDQDGMVKVSAPNGTLPPGTTILIINGGNGVVVGLTAGNDGQVTGTLPATIDDQLFVTVTDPFGNTTTFTRSEFVAADGATGIGPGGGTVRARCLSPATPERDATGCHKSAIQIPEGALDKGVTLKATVLTPEDYDAAHPNQRPEFGTLAQVIRLEASQAAEFNKEGDVTFAVPSLPAGVAPRDAFYYVLQRVDRGQRPDGTADYGFQVIDHAFVVCPGETPGYPATPPVICDPSEQRVMTASFPFPGLLTAGLIVVAGAHLVRAYAELMLIYAVNPLSLGRSPKGVVSGTVRRQVWEGPENGVKKLVYKNVAGAEVSGFDTDGVTPLMTRDGGLSVVTGKDGSFAFWDDSFSGGTVKVIVKTKTETKEVLAVESASADLTGLRHYDRAAIVNVTLDPEALPPAIPDVEVVLLKAEDRADLKGITLAGTPVLIAFRNNRKDTGFLIQGVEVGGKQFAVVVDPEGKYEAIQQPGTPFVPAVPGTFTVETTALDALGIPTPVRAAFRALTPGGGIDTDNNAPPAVMASSTTPRNNAFGVTVTVLPSVAFTEPVTHIAGNVTLKAITATGAEDVPIKISGITTQNGVIDDLGANPSAVVTAITILPLAGLLFGTKYTLSLGAGIQDLDKDVTNEPSPKNLTPYSTSFTTFGPEAITPEATGDFGARGMYVFGQKAYVLKHQISGYVWNGLINRYDISDPSGPKDEGLQASFQGRPSHLVGEEASVAAVAGTSFKPLPSTAHLYGINGEGVLEENALISFANGGSEGNVERLVLKGEKLYAATFRKGIQVADLVQARQAYVPCCSAEYFRMVTASSTDGQGFGGEAVSTIPVPSSSATGLSWFTGLAVTDGGDPLILATGDFGLAVAQEVGGLRWKGQPSFTGGGQTLISAYGLAVAAGLDGSAPLAYVVTSAQDGGNAILFVVNVQNPASPVVLGATRLRAPRGIASILIKDGKAYIGYMELTDQPSLTEIVSVENPSRPQYAGQIQGIGGHLSITADGLLLGVAHSALGAKPRFGGVKAAILEQSTLIRKITENPVILDINRKSIEPQQVSVGVAPPMRPEDIHSAELEVLRDDTVVQTIQIALDPGTSEGTATIPEGLSHPANARMTTRLVVNRGEDLAPKPRAAQLLGERVVIDPAVPTTVISGADEEFVTATSEPVMKRLSEDREPTYVPPSFQLVTTGDPSPGLAQTPEAAGIYSGSLAPTLTTTEGRVELRRGSAVLARTALITVVPGEAASGVLATETMAARLPADGRSSMRLEFTDLRDAAGNLIQDGTPITWSLAGNGELPAKQTQSTGGSASAEYRAGIEPGEEVITAEVAGVSRSVRITLLPVKVRVTRSAATFEVVASTDAGGPTPANGTEVLWSTLHGRIVGQATLTGGRAVATWVPTDRPGEPKARYVSVYASVGRSERDGGEFDRGEIEALPPGVRVKLGSERLRTNGVEPLVLQTPNGEPVDTVQARIAGQVENATPGVPLRLTLDSVRYPAVRPVAAYAMDTLAPPTPGATVVTPDQYGQADAIKVGEVVLSEVETRYGTNSLRFLSAGGVSIQSLAVAGLRHDFGFSGLVRLDAPNPGEKIIEKAGSYALRVTEQAGAARLEFVVLSNGVEKRVVSTQALAAATWYHFAARAKDGRLELQVGDSDEVALGDEMALADESPAPVVLGAAFSGHLDEIRVYDFTAAPTATFSNGLTYLDLAPQADGTAPFEILSTGMNREGIFNGFSGRINMGNVRVFEGTANGETRAEPPGAWFKEWFDGRLQACLDDIASGEVGSAYGFACEIAAGLHPVTNGLQFGRDVVLTARTFIASKKRAADYGRAVLWLGVATVGIIPVVGDVLPVAVKTGAAIATPGVAKAILPIIDGQILLATGAAITPRAERTLLRLLDDAADPVTREALTDVISKFKNPQDTYFALSRVADKMGPERVIAALNRIPSNPRFGSLADDVLETTIRSLDDLAGKGMGSLTDDALEGMSDFVYITSFGRRGPAGRVAASWTSLGSIRIAGRGALSDVEKTKGMEELFKLVRQGRAADPPGWNAFVSRGPGTGNPLSGPGVSTVTGWIHAARGVLKHPNGAVKAVDQRFAGYVGRPDLMVEAAGKNVQEEFKLLMPAAGSSAADIFGAHAAQLKRNVAAVLDRLGGLKAAEARPSEVAAELGRLRYDVKVVSGSAIDKLALEVYMREKVAEALGARLASQASAFKPTINLATSPF